MKEVTYREVDVSFLETQEGSLLIRAFQDIFAAAPWYEVYRCPNCRLQYPFFDVVDGVSLPVRVVPDDLLCTSCFVSLAPYWPDEAVRAYFTDVLGKEGSVCIIGTLPEHGIVGFAIGAVTLLQDFLDRVQLKATDLDWDVSPRARVGYLNEMAVVPAFRGKHIARSLYRHRAAALQRYVPEAFLFRSRPDAVTYRWYTAEFGYRTLFRLASRDPSDVTEYLGLVI